MPLTATGINLPLLLSAEDPRQHQRRTGQGTGRSGQEAGRTQSLQLLKPPTVFSPDIPTRKGGRDHIAVWRQPLRGQSGKGVKASPRTRFRTPQAGGLCSSVRPLDRGARLQSGHAIGNTNKGETAMKTTTTKTTTPTYSQAT